MPGLFSQCLLLCPLTVAVCSRWMPGVYENKHQVLFSQCLLLCPLTVAVCSRWIPGVYENKHQDSFPNVYCYVPWQSQFVLDGWVAFMKINPSTLFRTSTAMFPESQSLFSLDAWRLWKRTPGLFFQHLLLCPLTVAVCSRSMPGAYFHKCHDTFPNVYCYVPRQSQFVLDGCLAFVFINTRTLFPTSTAMSLDSRSSLSMDAFHLFS